MPKLNFGYGQLNDVSRTNVGPTYNPDTTSGVDSLKNSLETHYSYDIMSGLGSLKGICIGITQLYDKDGGEGWMSRMFSSTKENPRPLLAIKVRIPFLDSMLPDPLNPMDGEPYLDWGIIQLYNTFVAADEEISGDIPSIGDIVRVDYDDRTTRRGGIYLGKVFEIPIGLDIQENTKKYFDPKGNRLQGSGPTGTNNYVGAAWVPNPDGGGGKCKRERPPNTDGATFTLRGSVKGKQYTFNATKVGKWVMDVRAARDFIRMRDAAARNEVKLEIVSAFRTNEEQAYFYCKYKNEKGNAANPPGESNHQSGVALDLNTLGASKIDKSRGTGKVYEWLAKHAEDFGFKRIASEHWHWEHQPSLESIRSGS